MSFYVKIEGFLDISVLNKAIPGISISKNLSVTHPPIVILDNVRTIGLDGAAFAVLE